MKTIDYFTSILLDHPLEKEFKRIKTGKEISSLNIPYTNRYIDMMIKYYEIVEEYERCQILFDFKNRKNMHEFNFNCKDH